MRKIDYIIITLFVFIITFSCAYVIYNLIVNHKRKELVENINSVLPLGRYIYTESIDDLKSSKRLDDLLSRLSRVTSYKSANGEYTYILPEWIWFINYRSNDIYGHNFDGMVFPKIVKSPKALKFYDELLFVLNQAYIEELKNFENFKKKFWFDDKFSSIINRSIFVREREFEKVIGADYYGPYSSHYLSFSGIKVLIMNHGGKNDYVLNPNDYRVKDFNKYFYIFSIITFIAILAITFSILNYFQLSITKEIRYLILFILALCLIIDSVYYSGHKIKQIHEKDENLKNKFDTEIRIRFPKLATAADIMQYVKSTELRLVKNNFDEYNVEQSVSIPMKFLYSNSNFSNQNMWAENVGGLSISEKGLPYCINDKLRYKARFDYDKIAWTVTRFSKLNIYDVESAEDLERYEEECDSFINHLNFLIGSFILDNNEILEGKNEPTYISYD